ncbi:hypothetical protein OG21DRAFT_1323229 [Imleria badia]|nr:hypothetical protein OG21DRAFT_1323229 [Imleria badia]
MMLSRRSREPCWKMSTNNINYPSMRCLSLPELLEGGSDTTADAIIAMTMAAACFPDAQARVQEELDAVVGMDRCSFRYHLSHPTSAPSWNDWDDLPQLHAFTSEALRWRPVTPLGILSGRDVFFSAKTHLTNVIPTTISLLALR